MKKKEIEKLKETIQDGIDMVKSSPRDAQRYFDNASCMLKLNLIAPKGPKDEKYLWESGLECLGRDEDKKALKYFNRILKINPKHDAALCYKGSVLLNHKRYKRALEYIDKAIRINPIEGDNWDNKGRALMRMKRYTEAITCFDKALELETYVPNNTLLWKGDALFTLRKHKEALECYAMVAKSNDIAYSKDALRKKGILLLTLKKYKEAIRCFDEILLSDPANEEVCTCKAMVLEEIEEEKAYEN